MIRRLAAGGARPRRLPLLNSRRTLKTSTARQNSERVRYDPNAIERDGDDVDVCIVGAGPAGLSAAIRLKQLEREKGDGRELRVVVLEKGPEVGMFPLSYIVSLERLTMSSMTYMFYLLVNLTTTRLACPFWSCDRASSSE